MKIRVSVTIEIDRDAYEEAYGPTSTAEIREHVSSALVSAAQAPGIISSEGIVIDVKENR